MILACGNYLNGGKSNRGQADGFDIEILPKLKNLKNKDNNLLKYIVCFCKENLDFEDENMPFPEEKYISKFVNFDFEDEISKEITKLDSEVKKFENKTSMVKNQGNKKYLEPFCEIMDKFIKGAKKDIDDLNILKDDCSKKFDSTKKFFHFKDKNFDPSKGEPNPFFDIWAQFWQDYKEIWEKVNKEPKKKKKGFRERAGHLHNKLEGMKNHNLLKNHHETGPEGARIGTEELGSLFGRVFVQKLKNRTKKNSAPESGLEVDQKLADSKSEVDLKSVGSVPEGARIDPEVSTHFANVFVQKLKNRGKKNTAPGSGPEVSQKFAESRSEVDSKSVGSGREEARNFIQKLKNRTKKNNTPQ